MGSSQPIKTIHFNNCIRVYGIIMAIAANQYIYQQLADGYTVRRHIDDPVFNMKQMLQNVCFQFNNKGLWWNYPQIIAQWMIHMGWMPMT